MANAAILDTLLQDVRYGLRTLCKKPSFVAVATLTLALGIGLNSAMFSVIDAVLLRPLPYRDPGNLVTIILSNPSFPSFGLSGKDLTAIRSEATFLGQSGVSSSATMALAQPEGPVQMEVGLATAGLFETLGVKPLLGRTLQTGDDQPGQDRVVLLTEPLWRSRFQSNVRVLGSTITLNDRVYTI